MVKTFTSNEVEVLNPAPVVPEPIPEPIINPKNYDFPAGSRFFTADDKLFLIRKSYRADNTEMRLVYVEGDESIMMLKSVRELCIEMDAKIIKP